MQFWPLSFPLNWCFFLLLLANMLFKFKTLLYFSSLSHFFFLPQDQTLLTSWLQLLLFLCMLMVYSYTFMFYKGKAPSIWSIGEIQFPKFLPSPLQYHSFYTSLTGCMHTHKYSFTSFLDKNTGICNYLSSLNNCFQCCSTDVRVSWSSDHYKVLSNHSIDIF